MRRHVIYIVFLASLLTIGCKDDPSSSYTGKHAQPSEGSRFVYHVETTPPDGTVKIDTVIYTVNVGSDNVKYVYYGFESATDRFSTRYEDDDNVTMQMAVSRTAEHLFFGSLTLPVTGKGGFPDEQIYNSADFGLQGTARLVSSKAIPVLGTMHFADEINVTMEARYMDLKFHDIIEPLEDRYWWVSKIGGFHRFTKTFLTVENGALLKTRYDARLIRIENN
jgi:hypothetical protein